MEFLGRKVKKEFEGNGKLDGTVRSYDSGRGYFKIEYEDGNSEELELSKLTALLLDDDVQANERGCLGDDSVSGKGNYCFDSGSSGELDLNAVGGLDLNLNLNEGLDLNYGLVVVHDGDNFNVKNKVGKNRDEIIDLNMDVNEDDDENLIEEENLNERKGHCFDLNLGLDEGTKGLSDSVDCVGQLRESCQVAGKDPHKEEEVNSGNVDIEGVDLQGTEDKDCSVPLDNHLIQSISVEIEMQNPLCNDDFPTGLGLSSDVSACCTPKRRRGRKRKVPLVTDSDPEGKTKLTEANPDAIELKTPCNIDSGAGLGLSSDVISGSSLKGRLGRKRKVLLDSDTNSAIKTELTERNHVEIECKTPLCNEGSASVIKLNIDTVSGGAPKGRCGRKRKLSSDALASSITETVLRRSTRRARKSALLDLDNVSHSVVFSDATNELSPSPTASAVTEEKTSDVVGQEGSEEQNVLPPKLELPPSSGNLNLGDMPVIDVFSVYSFLRSFSSLLFLSPFELEDFVSSLNCNAPSLLFDSIHVSLLNTLRKHLESLPDDSSQSAYNCLRCHNWDLLDMITWPIFLVDYLLTYSSGLKSGFDLCCLKLLERDYYKLSPSVKIEILRCLCDDVIEADSMKSEINKRGLVTEPTIDFDRNTKFDNSKRRKAVMDIAGSCVTEDDNNETVDWNSDECCLCKMDGNLICCDGCPAAFHSRCVGVISNHLPEGDWYCPECVIDKNRPWLKVGKTMRGADLLGTDIYGQLYYHCCGYLLVLEDRHNAASFKYYLRDDLPAVIEVLKSSSSIYYTILSAIYKQWDLSSEVVGAKKDCGLTEPAPMQLSTPLDAHLKISERLAFVKSDTVDHVVCLGDQTLSLEGSGNDSQAVTDNDETTKLNLRSRHSRVSDRLETLRKFSVMAMALSGKDNDSAKPGQDLFPINAGIVSPASSTGYVNYYSFALTASAVANQFSGKSSNKDSEDALGSVDTILSEQMKAISDKFMEFCWPNTLNILADARKENCGWCLTCKVPEVERECLISLYSSGPSLENFTSEVLGIRSKKTQKSHLVEVISHILCVEERLQGLLLGPWLNPHYSKSWRKTLLRVTGIASVKNLLLKLESNLRSQALSADWTKHVDSAVTVGSAVHIVTTSMRGPSRIVRKRARCPGPEEASTSNAASGLGLLWWRGGRLSRRLFSWKVLPHALASKAARQGGFRKIPGILYPEGSEFAKRSRFVVWRAGVELSKSVEQLALQVREFHANIRWDDIENNSVSLKLEKDSKKPLKSFKKVIVRRKSLEGNIVKYLLDFGKRRFIPDVVLRYGSKVEESSGDRKKFWLEESHLPLHLLKAFEQKILARKSNKVNLGKLLEHKRVVNQPTKRKGFSYLFSKAERSENYQCGHCNKDVLIREAVSCRICKGSFHKRHVRKSPGAINAESTYTCHKCLAKKYVRADARRENLASQRVKNSLRDSKQLSSSQSKLRSKAGGNKPVQGNKQLRKTQKNKKVTVVVPLRRSPRKSRCVLLQNKKIRAHKRGKRKKSTKEGSKRQLKSPWRKKRSQCYPIFWLNGLHLSRKPDDERLLYFKSKNLLVLCGDPIGNSQEPKCILCRELEYSPRLIYIACELCGDWFHGDALGLKKELIDMLIGFKCHICLGRSPPSCPHLGAVRIEATNLVALNNNYEGMNSTLKDTDERLLGPTQTQRPDEIEQLACCSVQKSERVEEICSTCSGHDQQHSELMASNGDTLVQKEAINFTDSRGE